MSQCSQASTIPYELSEAQDEIFLEELNAVDQLYFVDRQSENQLDASPSPSDNDTNYESDFDDDKEEPSLGLELNTVDNSEGIKQDKFRRETCGCREIYGTPDSSTLDFQDLVEFRENCLEMSREELDLVIKAELLPHRSSGGKTKKQKTKDRQRASQLYFFKGQKICRQTFCFLHGIERKKLQSIASSLDHDGLKPRVHGNTKRLPAHSLTYTDRDRIVSFICKYASDHALPLPGRLPNFKKSTVLLLPSDKSIADIHSLYESSAAELGYRSISLRTFQRTWSDLCPHIVIAKPCTDLCQSCQTYSHKLASRGGKMDETENSGILEGYKEHLEAEEEQRNYYRKQTADSKNKLNSLAADVSREGNSPCSIEGENHYSWDFAQQVHYPHHCQQVGPIYFKTPRKCNVFGVCSEGSGKQTFYLLDEAEMSGKGANCVVSMAHHYFQYYGLGETDATVHFDNASGQNKNNVVLWYGLWRVLTGLHNSIEYSMMIAGHTKFAPDWHFGLWKVKWRSSDAETMSDIATTVERSSRSGHNVPQLVNDQNKPVNFYHWRNFLSQFFKPLKHISQFHHFYTCRDEPGIVLCRTIASSVPERHKLLKASLPVPGIMPETVLPPGLEPDRQWYLYDQIREFFKSTSAMEQVCPVPLDPKKDLKVDSDELKMEVKSCGKRKMSLLH